MSAPLESPALDPAAVELVNAHGPYTHGAWATGKVVVGNEEALAGRSVFMVSKIRQALTTRFSPDQLRTMTVVDVGCYDGWVLCQLEDLPVARLIGVEPRQKNLDKGRMIRQLLGVTTRCEFRQGSIETLTDTLADIQADIVICNGLFHHLASVADGVARLHAICRQFLFIETLCLPSSLQDDRLREALELKDLPYFFGRKDFGVTGHKLESAYSDGSATRLSVVSLPSVDALRMFLEVQGFDQVTVAASPEQYRQAVPGGWRDFSAVCLTAVPGAPSMAADRWIAEYESGLVQQVWPIEVTQALAARYGAAPEPEGGASEWAALIGRTLSLTGPDRGEALAAVGRLAPDRLAVEIVKTLAFAPGDKITVEYAKSLIAAGRLDEAVTALQRVTQRLNADWRSVYRSFCLLAWIGRWRGDAAMAARYRELCLTANPQFPAALLEAGVEGLRPVRLAATTSVVS